MGCVFTILSRTRTFCPVTFYDVPNTGSRMVSPLCKKNLCTSAWAHGILKPPSWGAMLEAVPLSALFRQPLLLQPRVPAGPASCQEFWALPQAGEASVLNLSAILQEWKMPQGNRPISGSHPRSSSTLDPSLIILHSLQISQTPSQTSFLFHPTCLLILSE